MLQMLSINKQTFLALAKEALIYPWSYSTGIFSISLRIFLVVLLSGATVVNFVLQTTPGEKITRIKIGWTCGPNTTADNFVPKDIGQSLLHSHTCGVGSSWVFLKLAIDFFFCQLWKELPKNYLYISFAINYFVKKHRSNNTFCT
jgi:hypothetical protein